MTAALDAEQRASLNALVWASIHDGLSRSAWSKELRADAPRLDLDASATFLGEPGATFVTLHRNAQLRGCIGTTRAYQPLGQDVVDHAFAAAFRDPRFDGLRPEELADLEIEISVLGAPRPIPAPDEQTLIEQLRVGVDGLILTAGHRSATFLPSVWEGLPDRRAFVSRLLIKAGFVAGTWPEGLRAQVYTVQKWPAPSPANA
jgi:AmmeMemoRadiSam system protein A